MLFNRKLLALKVPSYYHLNKKLFDVLERSVYGWREELGVLDQWCAYCFWF